MKAAISYYSVQQKKNHFVRVLTPTPKSLVDTLALVHTTFYDSVFCFLFCSMGKERMRMQRMGK